MSKRVIFTLANTQHKRKACKRARNRPAKLKLLASEYSRKVAPLKWGKPVNKKLKIWQRREKAYKVLVYSVKNFERATERDGKFSNGN